ncbi:T9SS type A sorting domain-containing protein [Formosa sediminum]|uniref:T9SS type A sorting domain-containing protein n=1 Tax=Formosa sediminum TaxID=2594004 RepID=A0A516GUP3_9FLAO|nr:T9SS type A sorting domain-containing protein [Formosa sediminum]QDO95239.1 T9SS type A sorting domain-containing protein [Formosa sediminum]
MKQIYILAILLTFTLSKVNAQSIEDFETETIGETTFTDQGQSFTIVSNSSDTFSIYHFPDGGWNGTTTDNRFIDNSEDNGPVPEGTSFSIITTDGNDINLNSFYLFVSNYNLTGPGTPTTLTFEGKKDGTIVFVVYKSNGIVNGASYFPNNGYTFIDFTTEGGTDNTNVNIDEIHISTTNDADYISLDAFNWSPASLSINDFEVETNEIKIVPNPASDFIQLNKLNTKEIYTIYNTLGQEVKEGIVFENDKIDIKSLENGLYFLKIDGKTTMKFLKK